MKINDVLFNCELEDILNELQTQLQLNNSIYFQKKYKRSGDDLMVQCPYHANGQERKPSA